MIAEGLPCVIVQPGGVYGPGDTSQLADLLDQFLDGKMPLIPFPELGICLAHVEDIAAGIVLALDKGRPGETYVIGGPPTTMREAIGIVAAVSGRKAPKHAVPTVLMKAMTPIGPLVGKMMGQPPNLRELISSADNVTFWASQREGRPRARLSTRAGSRRACARRSRRTTASPRRRRPDALRAMRVIDVEHLGRPHVIGCWEVDGALVDPGPESSLETLLAALDGEQPGALAAHPHPPRPRGGDRRARAALARTLEVYVHERGAPHLIDPSRLLASAERLYGDAMERLWGEIVPVPEENVRPLAGGETVLGMRVAYTPGHASHHVCYLHEETGTAFVGDVAAVLIPATEPRRPPTPPPDIDIETWLESIDDRRRLGAGAARADPLRRDRRRRPSTWPSSASACARRRSWPASSTRAPTSSATGRWWRAGPRPRRRRPS